MEERKYAVDIDLANKTKAEIASALDSSDLRVLNRIGAFASLYDIRMPGYEHPVLVMKTEEPGSKQLLAFSHDRVESVCRDMAGLQAEIRATLRHELAHHFGFTDKELDRLWPAV